jgi:hypothetical protein
MVCAITRWLLKRSLIAMGVGCELRSRTISAMGIAGYVTPFESVRPRGELFWYAALTF